MMSKAEVPIKTYWKFSPVFCLSLPQDSEQTDKLGQSIQSLVLLNDTILSDLIKEEKHLAEQWWCSYSNLYCFCLRDFLIMVIWLEKNEKLEVVNDPGEHLREDSSNKWVMGPRHCSGLLHMRLQHDKRLSDRTLFAKAKKMLASHNNSVGSLHSMNHESF